MSEENGLGDSAPLISIRPPAPGMSGPPGKKKGPPAPFLDPGLIDSYKALAKEKLKSATTRREFLDIQVDLLAECVAVAAEIFRNHPLPDYAYQLAAINSSYNSSLAQLEKLKDPKAIIVDIEGIIKKMFTSLIKAMTLEVDKTKREFLSKYGDDRSTIDEMFQRMTNAIQPETQNLYSDLHESLKRTLGIKSSE